VTSERIEKVAEKGLNWGPDSAAELVASEFLIDIGVNSLKYKSKRKESK
jgi:hypothetical protein